MISAKDAHKALEELQNAGAIVTIDASIAWGVLKVFVEQREAIEKECLTLKNENDYEKL